MSSVGQTDQSDPSDPAGPTGPQTPVVDDPALGRFADRRLRRRITPGELVRHTGTMAWRALVKMFRNPEQLVDVVLMPILFTVMFANVFGGAIAGSVADYLPLMIPGIMAQTALTACVSTGVQLREDMDKGVFDRFRALPMARLATLAGPMVADLVRYALAGILTVAVGALIGYRPDGGPLGVLAGILLITVAGWSLAWIFTWLGVTARSVRAVQGISMMILFPLTFLSNAFVPVETLPGWLRTFVEANPVSHVVSATRDLLNDGAFTLQVAGALGACAVVVLIFLPLSLRAYQKKI